MKKVKYVGELDSHLTTINVIVKNGDIIEVEDDFINGNFEEVVEDKKKKDVSNTKEVNN